jgi:hypothetical protein
MDTLSYGLPLGAIMQVAYVVEDIEAEMDRWTRVLGVGPFFYIPHFPLQDVVHRGKPADIDVDVALACSGSICCELIRQNCRSPSPLREVVEARGYGFHHWAVGTRTFDQELARREKAGTRVASTGAAGIGARFAYLDTVTTLGGMVELIEITPAVDGVFSMIHAAAQTWDGRHPVRPLGADGPAAFAAT